MTTTPAVPERHFEQLILIIRGNKVLLDSVLAGLYGVSTKALLQAIRRNRKRFPEDFMFQSSPEEAGSLRSQSVTLKKGRGKHRKYLPIAFTEQGVAMLSSVLRSERAILVNITIMRAFVRIRQVAGQFEHVVEKLDELEARLIGHDGEIDEIFEAIRELTTPEELPRRKIGY